jgi:tetratricopeptide (TPR) repeat protein
MFRIFLDFIRNNYKLIFLILAVMLFFWVYNTYLVDRSLLNLRFILEKVTVMKDNLEDARKIALILDAMLTKETAAQGKVSVQPKDLEAAEKILAQAQQTPQLEKDARQLKEALRYAVASEVTGQEAADRSKVMLEMVNDILTKPESISQLEDAKFALKEIIEDREQKRPALLAVIDRVAQTVLPKRAGISQERLEKQVSSLKRKIRNIKEKDKLQEAYYELGNIFTQLNKLETANAYYRQAIELQPNSHLAERSKFNLSWNEKTRGNLEEALKGFQALSKTTADAQLGVSLRFQIADILRKQAKYDEAISLLQEIASTEPDVDLTQLSNYLVGQVYLYDLGETEKAQVEFQKAKALDQATSFSQYIDKQEGTAITEQYLIKGFKLLKQGYFMSLPDKYAEAVRNFDLALGINSKEGFSYTGKSLIFLWQGEREKALDSSKSAAKLLPDNEVTCMNLAYVYLKLGMIDEAIAELKRLVSDKPNLWQAYYNLGYAYVVKNSFAEAASALKEAARVNPDSAMILNNQGWCLWRLGKYSEAIHLFERALVLEPQFPEALFNLGMIYKAAGRYDEAKAALDELFKVAPGYPRLEYYLSDLNRLLRLKSSPPSRD